MAKKQTDGENPAAKGASKRDPVSKADSRDSKAKPVKAEARPSPITRFFRYVEASRAELRKVTWPSIQETRKATIAVLSFVGIMAIILGLIDLGLSSLIKAILS